MSQLNQLSLGSERERNRFRNNKEWSLLGVADTGEARPANVRAIGEMLQHVLSPADLVQHGRPPDARLEGRRSSRGGGHCY